MKRKSARERESLIAKAMAAVPPSKCWEWTDAGRRLIAVEVLRAVGVLDADRPGVYGTCDVCWEREWLPLKRAQDNAEIEELRRLLANATDPENSGDWEEAREAGWAYVSRSMT